MKTNYSIYYSYKTIGDVIIIVFDNEKIATSHTRKGPVEIIYYNDEVIGYNIFNIKEIMKIKSCGLIYLPSPTLIEVINNILENNGVEKLAPVLHSGYYIGQVSDVISLNESKNFIVINLDNEIINVISKCQILKANDKVVVAKAGTRLSTGEIVKEGVFEGTLLNGHLCTNYELGLYDGEDQVLVIDESMPIGKDFFNTEVM